MSNYLRRNPCTVSDPLTDVSVSHATAGESLRWARGAVSLPQSAMAKKAGIAEGTLSEIETGLIQPKPEQLAAIHGAAMDELADSLEKFAILIRYLRKSRVA